MLPCNDGAGAVPIPDNFHVSVNIGLLVLKQDPATLIFNQIYDYFRRVTFVIFFRVSRDPCLARFIFLISLCIGSV